MLTKADDVMPLLIAAQEAWRGADGAMTRACRELAAVPGAAHAYEQLYCITRNYQRSGRRLLDEAIAGAQRAEARLAKAELVS